MKLPIAPVHQHGAKQLVHRSMNGGNSNLPPCGAVDPTDPNSAVRCEIVPEMNTESPQITGTVTNRTLHCG